MKASSEISRRAFVATSAVAGFTLATGWSGGTISAVGGLLLLALGA